MANSKMERLKIKHYGITDIYKHLPLQLVITEIIGGFANGKGNPVVLCALEWWFLADGFLSYSQVPRRWNTGRSWSRQKQKNTLILCHMKSFNRASINIGRNNLYQTWWLLLKLPILVLLHEISVTSILS